MDNIYNSNSKLSCEELLEQNNQLKKQVQEIQKASKKVEDKYHNVIESSPFGVILYSLEEDRLIFNGYNKSAETILGVELESLMGKTIEEAFPPLAQTEIPFEYKKTAKTGEVFFTNQVDYNFDKIRGAFEVTAFQVSQNNIAVNFFDITGRIKKEVELKESQQKFKSLFDNIEEGVALHKMIFDEDNNPIDFVWVDVNPTYEKLTQLKKKDVLGEKGKVVIPNIEQKWYDLYAEVVLTGIPRTVTDHSEYLDKYWEVKVFRPQEGHFAVAMTDFTEKVIAEEELIKAKEEAEKNHEKLLEAQKISHVGSWEYIVDTDSVTWSKELYNIFERPYELPTPKYSEQAPFYTEESFAILDKAVQDCVQNEIPYDIELDIITSNGNIKHIISKGNVKKDTNNKIIGCNGTAQDITQKKNAERELIKAKEEINERLQQIEIIQANTPNIIWKWDIDKEGNFINVYISAVVDKFLGLPEGSIDNSIDKFFSYILPEYLPLVDAAIKNAIDNPNKLFIGEYEVKKADGKLAWFSSSGKVITENEESTIYGSTIDITKRKQNEKKLLQSDRVFNLSLDMFCIAGFDGYFKYLNPAWEKTLGWSIEELLSKPWLDFVHPDDAKDTENIKSVIVDGKEIYQFENRYICKDGSIKWLSWNSQPFPKENIMIGAVRDITETKKNENELRLNEKRLNNLVKLSEMTSKPLNELYDFVLIKAIELTNSKIGFLGFVNEDETIVNIYNWSESVMEECTVKNIDMEFNVEKAGIWGEVVRTHETLLLNDYKAPNSLKKGTPAGHVKIHNYLSIPVIDDNKAVAMISVANKDGGFNELDINQLKLLIYGMWKTVQLRKEHEELVKHQEQLEELVKERTKELEEKNEELENFNQLFVGREFRIKELKDKVKDLEEKLKMYGSD